MMMIKSNLQIEIDTNPKFRGSGLFFGRVTESLMIMKINIQIEIGVNKKSSSYF